jgi:hypothetical protein
MKESARPVLKTDKTLRHLHEGIADRGVPGQSYGFGWIQFQSPFGRTLQHESDIAAFETRAPSPVATTSL